MFTPVSKKKTLRQMVIPLIARFDWSIQNIADILQIADETEKSLKQTNTFLCYSLTSLATES